MSKHILLTGASGNMGIEAVKIFAESNSNIKLRLFSVDTPRDRERLKPFFNHKHIEIFWGDIRNQDDVNKAVEGTDFVLHIAAVISPQADHHPELAWNVNYKGTKHIIDAIKARPDRDQVKLVTIGSIAMTGNRVPPYHYGRIGDPMAPSAFDVYALSKIAAERYLIESGLSHWVSLRQTGIMHESLFEVNDGIGYHMPLDNRMEWVTAKDSGRLLVNICLNEVPNEFWRNIYHISGGESCRWIGIDFLEKMYGLLGINFKDFEKPNYYALRNFHGQYFYDADKLEEYIHFRSETLEDVMDRLSKKLPFKLRILKYAPKFLVKRIMRKIALKGDTPLSWIARNHQEKINAFLISKERWESIPDWENITIDRDPEVKKLDHGYDESKSEHEWDIEDMHQAAKFRGGTCLSESMKPGDLFTPLQWSCADNHLFSGSPFLILKAGHWCDKCVQAPWNFDHQAKNNAFLAQVWYADHGKEENKVYGKEIGKLIQYE